MKLLLGIPTSGAPARPFLESLAALDLPASITSFERAIVSGNFIPAQRELILRKAVAAGVDLVMMCDDDMIVPPRALASLLAVLERDTRCALAGALYYSRDGFRPMAVDDWDPQNTTSASIPAFDREPVNVGGIGFGCVLFRVQAVDTLALPYFGAHVYIEPGASRVRVCDEDYLFCHRLRASGYDVVLHPGVRCGHYDRLSGKTFPEQWEEPSATMQRRIAVLEQGQRRLVPLRDAQSASERQERISIDYIWAD